MDGFIDPLLIRNDYLLQSHTRCPAASRWRGGTQSALDSWGKGSPPAGGRSREHLHPSSWRQSPPEHVQKRKQRNALQNSDSWGVCVLVWAHLQHAGAFSLDGAARRHIQFIHLLLTADKEFNQLVNNLLQLVSFFFFAKHPPSYNAWFLPFPDLDVSVVKATPLKCHQSIQFDFYKQTFGDIPTQQAASC